MGDNRECYIFVLATHTYILTMEIIRSLAAILESFRLEIYRFSGDENKN